MWLELPSYFGEWIVIEYLIGLQTTEKDANVQVEAREDIEEGEDICLLKYI